MDEETIQWLRPSFQRLFTPKPKKRTQQMWSWMEVINPLSTARIPPGDGVNGARFPAFLDVH
eukprot:12906562-Prorocentrum_lima.AAC.1